MRKIVCRIIEILITCAALALCAWIIYWAAGMIMPSGTGINIVSGTSMEPTLTDKQITFSDDTKELYRGDIVTSYFPDCVEDKEVELIIKRVIGIPGDSVMIDETGVYINGEKIEEDYLTEEAKQKTYRSQKKVSLVLKEKEYYLMGDNREVSYDSRSFGPITEDKILYRQKEFPTGMFLMKIAMLIGVAIINVVIFEIITLSAEGILRKFRRG